MRCTSGRIAALAAVSVAALLTIGCGPSIKRSGYLDQSLQSKDPGCQVAIKEEVQVKAEKGTVLGTMKLGDTGFSTKCGEDRALEILRAEACKLGADLIVLHDIKPPDVWSTCYRVTADFVRMNDPQDAQRLVADTKYDDGAVDERVKKGNALTWVLSGIGFALGFLMVSMLTPRR